MSMRLRPVPVLFLKCLLMFSVTFTPQVFLLSLTGCFTCVSGVLSPCAFKGKRCRHHCLSSLVLMVEHQVLDSAWIYRLTFALITPDLLRKDLVLNVFGVLGSSVSEDQICTKTYQTTE